MAYKSELGQFGEDLACEYLVKRGYKIIERNFKKPWGELDIIAKAPDKTLVFIEVKTMKENLVGLKPEDQLTSAKLQKLKRAASLYAGHRQELIKNDKGWRIDLITLTIEEKDCLVRHYKNIS
jgi:putative endonuclease